VSKPFFNSLQSWIFSGQLHDPFDEFFIQLNPSLSKRHANRPYEDYGMGGDGLHGETSNDPHMIWEKRYIFVKEMLPVFINEEFGRKVIEIVSSTVAAKTLTGDCIT
jgi:gamma-tubulin complex component 3